MSELGECYICTLDSAPFSPCNCKNIRPSEFRLGGCFKRFKTNHSNYYCDWGNMCNGKEYKQRTGDNFLLPRNTVMWGCQTCDRCVCVKCWIGIVIKDLNI